MLFRGQSIWSQTPPQSKTRYGTLLHWREAAKWAGVAWATFSELDTDEQGMIIAQYECMTRLEALEAQAAQRDHAVAMQRAKARAR